MLQNENAARSDFRYDALDRLIEETGFDGRQTQYRYDRSGLLMSELQRGSLSASERQAQRRAREGQAGTLPDPWGEGLADESAPLIPPPGAGILTRYQRDGTGRLIGKQVVGHIVDEHGQLQPQYRASRYGHDGAGRLARAVNDQGARIELGYDALGRLTQETRTGQGIHSQLRHHHDALGNRIATTLPDGRRISWLRYGSGHLHQIELDGHTISDIERDALHRENGRTQGRLTSRYQRDARGRLIDQGVWRIASGESSQNSGPDEWAALQTLRAQYEPDAPQTQSNLPRPMGIRLIGRRYHYDLAGQLSELQDNLHGAARYGYDSIGRIVQAQLPADIEERFAFDPAHNLVEPQALPNALRDNRLVRHGDTRYHYDTHGNVIEKNTGEHTRVRLVWDVEHRLQKAIVITQAGSARPRTLHIDYRYDALGRRLDKHVQEIPIPQKPEDVRNNRYAATRKRKPPYQKHTRYTWDGDLLLAEEDGQKQSIYLYEPESFAPLARIETPVREQGAMARMSNQVASQLPPGIPLQGPELANITIPDSEDIAENAVIFMQQMLGRQRQVVERVQARMGGDGIDKRPQEAEQDLTPAQMWPGFEGVVPGNWTQPADTEEQQGPEQAKEKDWTVYYYHNDHLGTPRELTHEDGTIVWRSGYRVWGQLLDTHAQAGIEQNLRFPGQYYDQETGLHYNRHRYYDPQIGRFISQDPIGLEGGINLYQYAPNPLDWIDPLGLTCCNCLYRGVSANHPALEDAKKGIVAPANPKASLTPEQHAAGGLTGQSQFVSWTSDKEIALYHANKDGPGGVLLSVPRGAPAPGDSWAWGWAEVNQWGEAEILQTGTRTGAHVSREGCK